MTITQDHLQTQEYWLHLPRFYNFTNVLQSLFFVIRVSFSYRVCFVANIYFLAEVEDADAYNDEASYYHGQSTDQQCTANIPSYLCNLSDVAKYRIVM